MIQKEVFNEIADEAQLELIKNRLNDALFLMPALVKELGMPIFSDEYEHIQSDYNAMLDFLSTGGVDTAQEQMQIAMIKRGYELLNRMRMAYRLLNVESNTNDYIKETYAKYLDYTSGIKTSADHSYLFWTGLLAFYPDTGIDEWEVRKCIESCSTNLERKLLFAGLLLNLWEYFTPTLCRLMLEYASTEPTALLAIVLTAIRHEDLLCIYPEVEKAIVTLCQNEATQHLICHANRELFISSQSGKLEEKIKSELLPVLLEGAKDERLRMGFSMDEEDDDAFEKLLKKQSDIVKDKKIDKKRMQFLSSAKRLLDLHQMGLDINTDLIVNSMRLPFFQEMANWFRPFDAHDPHIESITYEHGKANALLRLALEQGNLSDLDCYAFTLLLGHTLRNSATKSFVDMIMKESKEAEAILGGDYPLRTPSAEQEITNIIRALYRLHEFSRWKSQMTNLFKHSFNFLHNEYLKHALLHNTKALSEIAKLMVRCDSYIIPYVYFRELVALEGSTVETLQLMALCMQAQQKHQQAVNHLVQADILNPNDVITIKQLIDCYDKLKRYDDLLECLLRLEQLIPNSSKITTDTALCLMKLERYQEAAQRFYKLEFEEKKVIPSMRAIAWCSFKQHKYETAMRYYKKLYDMPSAPKYEDYLNGGHVAWLLDDIPYALTLYRKYIQLYLTDNSQITDALEPFDEDFDELVSHGKSAREISLMHELITRHHSK